MLTLTLTDYYKGRDKQYPAALTAEIAQNAAHTIALVNQLLTRFYAAKPQAAQRSVNSGWRPPIVNKRVKKAARASKHLTARACDLSDDDGDLDTWLMTPAGQQALTEIGLWMEHPDATPRWAHLQTIPPASGHRVFYP